MLQINHVLETLFQFYISVWISMDIFKEKNQIAFILYRNCVFEAQFQFTYEFRYQTLEKKIQTYSFYLKIVS